MEKIELPTTRLFKEIADLEKQYKGKRDYESWVRLSKERDKIYRRFAMEGLFMTSIPRKRNTNR
jgi:hypothetical protein